MKKRKRCRKRKDGEVVLDGWISAEGSTGTSLESSSFTHPSQETAELFKGHRDVSHSKMEKKAEQRGLKREICESDRIKSRWI